MLSPTYFPIYFVWWWEYSFDASLVIYINSTNIPPIMIINRIYETQNLLSLYFVSFLVGLRTYQHPCIWWAVQIIKLLNVSSSAFPDSSKSVTNMYSFHERLWAEELQRCPFLFAGCQRWYRRDESEQCPSIPATWPACSHRPQGISNSGKPCRSSN